MAAKQHSTPNPSNAKPDRLTVEGGGAHAGHLVRPALEMAWTAALKAELAVARPTETVDRVYDRASKRMAREIAAVLTAPPASSPASPDDELIALCRAWMAAVDAYELDDRDSDTSPHWREKETIEARLAGMTATTLAGVRAKAEVAAKLARQPDGSEDFDTSYTGHWPGQAVRDLLRLLPPT